ncbi:MAG: hypothetical protein ACK2UL_11075 [Anaerolineae bacterium]
MGRVEDWQQDLEQSRRVALERMALLLDRFPNVEVAPLDRRAAAVAYSGV